MLLQAVRNYVRQFPGRWGREVTLLRRAEQMLPPGHIERDSAGDEHGYDCLGQWGVPLNHDELVRMSLWLFFCSKRCFDAQGILSPPPFAPADT